MQEDQIKIPERIKGFSPVVFFRISNDFSYRRAYCPPRLRRAARCAVWLLCSFFLIRERTNQESGPRGLIPLGTPQRVLVSATLSLRATRRDATQLQRLRARLKKRPRSLQGRRFLLSHRGALRSPVSQTPQAADMESKTFFFFAMANPALWSEWEGAHELAVATAPNSAEGYPSLP